MHSLLLLLKKIYLSLPILDILLDTERLQEWMMTIDSSLMIQMLQLHINDLSEELTPFLDFEKKENFKSSIRSLRKHQIPLPLLIFLVQNFDLIPVLYPVIKSLKYVNSFYLRNIHDHHDNNKDTKTRSNQPRKYLECFLENTKVPEKESTIPDPIKEFQEFLIAANTLPDRMMDLKNIYGTSEMNCKTAEILIKNLHDKIIANNQIFLEHEINKEINLFYEYFDSWLLNFGKILLNYVVQARIEAQKNADSINPFRTEMKDLEKRYSPIINKVINGYFILSG